MSLILVDAELGPIKLCPKCHEWWPADPEFYYRSTSTRCGLQSWCRACWSEYARGNAKRQAYSRAWHARKRAQEA